MKTRLQAAYTAVAWLTVAAVLLVVFSLAGCAPGLISKDEKQAIVTECLSEPACMVAKMDALSELKIYERDAFRAEQRDLVAAQINGCLATNNGIPWFNKLTRTEQSKLDRAIWRNGAVSPDDLPTVVFLVNFPCVSKSDVQRMLEDYTREAQRRY